MLEREISKGVPHEKTIAEIGNDLQDPILVWQGATSVWRRFLCRDLKGDLQLGTYEIVCFTGIKAKMMVMTDTTNPAKSSSFPDFK